MKAGLFGASVYGIGLVAFIATVIAFYTFDTLKTPGLAVIDSTTTSTGVGCQSLFSVTTGYSAVNAVDHNDPVSVALGEFALLGGAYNFAAYSASLRTLNNVQNVPLVGGISYYGSYFPSYESCINTLNSYTVSCTVISPDLAARIFSTYPGICTIDGTSITFSIRDLTGDISAYGPWQTLTDTFSNPSVWPFLQISLITFSLPLSSVTPSNKPSSCVLPDRHYPPPILYLRAFLYLPLPSPPSSSSQRSGFSSDQPLRARPLRQSRSWSMRLYTLI